MPSYIILCEATIRLLIFSYNVHWQWLCRKCTWFTGSSKWEYRIFSESVNGLFSLQENGYCYIVIHCFIQYCCMHTSLTNDANGILHLHFKMFLFWSYLCSVFCTKFLNFSPVSHYFQIVFQVLIVQILVWFKFTQGHLRRNNNFLTYIFHHSGITTSHTPAKEAKMARA